MGSAAKVAGGGALHRYRLKIQFDEWKRSASVIKHILQQTI